MEARVQSRPGRQTQVLSPMFFRKCSSPQERMPCSRPYARGRSPARGCDQGPVSPLAPSLPVAATGPLGLSTPSCRHRPRQLDAAWGSGSRTCRKGVTSGFCRLIWLSAKAIRPLSGSQPPMALPEACTRPTCRRTPPCRLNGRAPQLAGPCPTGHLASVQIAVLSARICSGESTARCDALSQLCATVQTAHRRWEARPKGGRSLDE